ncbi:hypothetical protein Gotri_018822 [Gossypium trilobum]|uniref:Uncharacterized protein n=1 Tax=Gossypium trilobum TaxID=34281 RepID=A0A7J9EB74_9ROSI|nr:hypothetical protein [Gossypium trilobum]
MEHLMWSHLWRIYLGNLLEIKGVVEVYIFVDSDSAIAIGNKLVVYGWDCGDQYHRDVDVFDRDNSIWSRLTVQGSLLSVGASHVAVSIVIKPQYRFSHTVVFTKSKISIYKGYGEGEHRIKYLLVLQLGAQYPNRRYNMCTIFGSHRTQKEQSLFLSQHSSPSQSNQEQAPPKKTTSPIVSHV